MFDALMSQLHYQNLI